MKIREAQKLAEEIHEKISKEKWNGFMIATDLLEEAGEVAACIKGIEGLKTKEFTKEELAEELSDLLYSTLLVASHYGIDVSDKYRDKIEKYKQRYGD